MMNERTIYSHYTDKELVDAVSLRTNLSTLETELLSRLDRRLQVEHDEATQGSKDL